MRRRIFVTLALIGLALVLPPSQGMGQSQKEGLRLFFQGRKLVNKAHSRADVEKGVRKYKEALRIFQQLGSQREVGITLNDLGLAHNFWGQQAGRTWLQSAPKIRLLPRSDVREPYPISWEFPNGLRPVPAQSQPS